ncbi:MAG: DUF1801 domain-containing protein [Actinomycetota bacterium]|nr:DUF1801 domain-containing protein [Actinomycetota bacterium]
MSQLEARELIRQIANDLRRADASSLLDLMIRVTGEEPEVWNGNTIGFGRYHYRYASGQEGDFFKVGFAPRDQNITLYIMSGLRGFEDILERLGPHRAAKSTVKITNLADIAKDALDDLIEECVRHVDQVEKSLGALPRMSDIPPRTPR